MTELFPHLFKLAMEFSLYFWKALRPNCGKQPHTNTNIRALSHEVAMTTGTVKIILYWKWKVE